MTKHQISPNPAHATASLQASRTSVLESARHSLNWSIARLWSNVWNCPRFAAAHAIVPILLSHSTCIPVGDLLFSSGWLGRDILMDYVGGDVEKGGEERVESKGVVDAVRSKGITRSAASFDGSVGSDVLLASSRAVGV